MSAGPEYKSVDLTEDEMSSDENVSHGDSPLHFVDCSKVEHSNPPTISSTTTVQKGDLETNSLDKFISIHLKSPADTTNKIEIVTVDSDDESTVNVPSEPRNKSDPQNPTIYSPKQPGKVIIIKKNNKYYKIVIPHNVMPNFDQSIGPVLINIPEVGPLVITTDPKAKKTNTTAKSTAGQEIFNLDAVADKPKKNATPVKYGRKVPELTPREVALCDKKFCWTYIMGRKRDLDGFAFSDRLGFNRAEARRATKCFKRLETIVANKTNQLIAQTTAYDEFKRSLIKEKDIKLVKINEIVGKASGETHTISGQADEAAAAGYDSDLLLTKKVVILTGSGKIKAKRKAKLDGDGAPKTKLSKRERIRKFKARIQASRSRPRNVQEPYGLRPCYVDMIRDERAEEACRKLVRNRIRQRKSNGAVRQPKLPEPPQKFFEDISGLFLSRVIRSEERFRREMNFLKPMLIVNENNLCLIDYSAEFSKNNILYITEGRRGFPAGASVDAGFVSAVELGYVKLVDAELFCRYVTGKMDVAGGEGDHAGYCLART